MGRGTGGRASRNARTRQNPLVIVFLDERAVNGGMLELRTQGERHAHEGEGERRGGCGGGR